MYKLNDTVDRKMKAVIYKALCESVIRYGVALYGAAAQCHIQKINKLQKRCLETLFRRELQAGLVNIYLEVRTLTPKNFYKFRMITEHVGSSQFKVENTKYQDRNLRRREKFKVQVPSTVFSERTLQFIIPTLYNQVPQNFNEQNVARFKTDIYNWLLLQ